MPESFAATVVSSRRRAGSEGPAPRVRRISSMRAVLASSAGTSLKRAASLPAAVWDARDASLAWAARRTRFAAWRRALRHRRREEDQRVRFAWRRILPPKCPTMDTGYNGVMAGLVLALAAAASAAPRAETAKSCGGSSTQSWRG